MAEGEVNKDEITSLLENEVTSEVSEEEVSPDEEKARKDGWKPEAEYEGEDWVSAGEFVRRKSLFNKIHNQTREMKRMQESLTALKGHHDKVYESSYKRALSDLQAQRVSAIEDGDASQVLQIEDEMKRVESDKDEALKVAKPDDGPTEAFQEWVVDNEWFQENPRMRARAEELGLRYANDNPNIEDEEVYGYVRERMEIEYPDKFDLPKKRTRQTASAVETSTRGTKKSSKSVVLTEEETGVMRTLIRNGDITEEKYKADIALLQGR